MRYIALSFILFLAACQGNEQYTNTVLGPVPVSELGTTLEHEHILVDFIGADSTGYHRWVHSEVIDKALPFLEEIRDHGCRTFIDCTPAYIGRDPVLLRKLSEETGLNIITNTGWYGAKDDLFIPARAFEMSAEEIAGEWITEFREGIEGTGILPGFIKIGVNPDDVLSPMHEKLIRAAALTHLETGLVIKSHTGPAPPAFRQLEILQEMGVPADAFIWTHAQRGTVEDWTRAAGMGAWVSLDNVNEKNHLKHLENLQAMKSAGLLGRLLISHDSGWYRVGEENGGKFNPYSAIFEKLLPALLENGFTEEEINQLMVLNPAKAFSIN